MLHIPAVLDIAEVRTIRAMIAEAPWIDGTATAGHLSAPVKRNSQLPERGEAAKRAGALILTALEANPTFISAALPSKIVPPLFNRYGVGDGYGPHIDGSIRPLDGRERVRTDLSATLFLTPPEDYEGGELVVNDESGVHHAKFDAGDLLLYPGTTTHHVAPVTAGIRLASFFWVQSIVRDTAQRRMLYELDGAIQSLSGDADRSAILTLTGHYHNLIRMWADV